MLRFCPNLSRPQSLLTDTNLGLKSTIERARLHRRNRWLLRKKYATYILTEIATLPSSAMMKARKTYSRPSHKRCCGFILLISLLSLTVPVHGSDEKTEYGKIVRGTHDGIRFDNTCVSFTAFMRAGEFFDGLQRIRTPEGTEFRRNSKVVNYFPDQISVEIEAKVEMCSEVLRRLGVSVPGYAEAFMSTLRFEAKWKKGVRSRPAEIVSVELNRPAWPERTNDYVYVLTVSSHRVPLSDHVVVHVLSGDGETVARMSVRL